jgi:transcriptional regulator with XRE-family HTH domain
MVENQSGIMTSGDSQADARLAARLRGLRLERDLTLEGLAARAGVSRSMISFIERGESSPTANVLDKLAAGLGVTLASLFAEEEQPEAPPLPRRADQPAWRDPETGYARRNLSPPGFPSRVELVEVVLPARARVAFDTGSRSPAIDQQVWVLEGSMRVTVGGISHDLAAGDCLAMRVDRPTAFHNPADRPTRYLVALTMATGPAGRGGLRRREAWDGRSKGHGSSDHG